MLECARYLVFVGFFLCVSMAFAESLVTWRDVSGETEVTFSQGEGRGAFPLSSFSADMTFEPDHLQGSRIVFYMDLTSAFLPPSSLATPHVQQTMNIARSFAVRSNDKGSAIFTSTQIKKTGENSYIMQGNFDLNGKSALIEVPFTATIGRYFDLPKVAVRGQFSFNPHQFSSKALAAADNVDSVTINFNFIATPVS